MTNQNKNLHDDLDLNSNIKEESVLANKNKKKINRKTNNDDDEESREITKSKLVLIKKLLQNIKENNDRLLNLLSDFTSDQDEFNIGIGELSDEKFEINEGLMTEGRVIEGVFDGENMIGPDGKQYSVPANYASKSKLVEGDILKLTITAKGTFIYKQIGPIERARIVGVLDRLSSGDYIAISDGKKWKLLSASVTYFKGEAGDEVVILIPKSGESKWAAVENIVRKKE